MRSTLLKHLRGKGAGDRGPQFAVAFHDSCWVSNIIFACQISFLHVKYHFWLIIKFAYHLRPLIFVTLREHSCHQLLRYQLIGIATV